MKRFPVGTSVILTSHQSGKSVEIELGVVVKYALNCMNELVVGVEVAKPLVGSFEDNNEVKYIHPGNTMTVIRPVAEL